MAYNEAQADRIAAQLLDRNIEFEEKKMFGGLCIMLDEKMCMGIVKDDMMVRVNPEKEEKLQKMELDRWISQNAQCADTCISILASIMMMKY
jgi:TfoX/Sxy family transcriptional regulator of competence genes